MFWNKQGGGGALDATKLKATLRLACSRFDVAKNKKESLMKQNMREIATLLAAGPHPQEEKARIRVERLIKDDQRIEAYEILQLECQLLLERVQLLKHSTNGCPPDLVTCVSDLIYAAPRAGDDIPELLEIKNLLVGKFGKAFATDADTNKDEKLISPRIAEKLSLDPPTGYLVHNYMMKIAKLYEVAYEPTIQLTLEEAFEPIAAPIGFSIPVATGAGLGKDVYHPFKPEMPSTAAVATASSIPAVAGGASCSSSHLKMPPTNPDFHDNTGTSNSAEAASVTVMKAIAYVPEEEMMQEEDSKHSTTITDHNNLMSSRSIPPDTTTAPAASLPVAPQPFKKDKAEDNDDDDDDEDFTIVNSKERKNVDPVVDDALTGLSAADADTVVVNSNSLLEQTEPLEAEDASIMDEEAIPDHIADAAAAVQESKLESLRNRLQGLVVGPSKEEKASAVVAAAPTTTVTASPTSTLLPVETGIMTTPVKNHEEISEEETNCKKHDASTATTATEDPLRNLIHGDNDNEQDDPIEEKKSCLENDCGDWKISSADQLEDGGTSTMERRSSLGAQEEDSVPERISIPQSTPAEVSESVYYERTDDHTENLPVLLPANDAETEVVLTDDAMASCRGSEKNGNEPSSPPTTTTQKDNGRTTGSSSGSNVESEHITGAAIAGGAVGFVVAGSLGGVLGAAGAAHLASKATTNTEGGSKNKAATMARKCGKKVSKITTKLVQKMDNLNKH